MKNPIVYRSAGNYDLDEASNESAIKTIGPSLTVQSQAADADINVLMDRFGITGKMPENPHPPMYGDFTGISNYQEALDAVMVANANFMEMPAKVRARFSNNPQELLEFVADPRNMDEARHLGLLKEQQHGGSSNAAAGAGSSQSGSGSVPQGAGGTGPSGGTQPAANTQPTRA